MELGDSIAEEPFDEEGWEADQERLYTIAMLTCPYYWSEIQGGQCAHGCWEEPQCITNGPFPHPPDWPPERCLAAAVNQHVAFHWRRSLLYDRLREES